MIKKPESMYMCALAHPHKLIGSKMMDHHVRALVIFGCCATRLCSTHINVSFETDSETVSRPVDTEKVSLV